MKVLLTVPPISQVYDPSLPEVLLTEEDPMPPLGLMYIGSYLKKHTTHEVKILDPQVEKWDFKILAEKVLNEKPDVVGITTMTFTLLDVITTIKEIKSALPNVKIALGGPHVHIYPEETIRMENVDFLVLGEGEETFRELLDNIKDKEKLKNVVGLVFLDRHGNYVNTGIRPFNKNLDELPFPARELVPYKKYYSSLGKVSPVTTMFTSRGCPYQCIFCDRPHLGKNFRPRSAQNVVAEFEECARLGIKEIFIYDDTFAVDRKRVLEICDLIVKKGIKISWDIRTRVNTVDDEVLSALKKAGCNRIHFGVEAGTQRILDILKKGITIEMAKKAFRLARKHKIQTLGYFMLGSPTETKAEILETIRVAKKLDPDFAHFTITTPYPATALYAMGLTQGILPSDYWKKFAKNPTREFTPLFWEEILNKDQLNELMRQAYRSFYLRPAYIARRIMAVRSFKEFFAKAKMGLKILEI
jgi:radical SAM superfamily enzyme YgiQ (UPF0313 family)